MSENVYKKMRVTMSKGTDFSAKYIKMCKEAKELQENWIPMEHDFFTDSLGQQRCLESKEHFMALGTNFPEKQHIFLPRQDQLQEMLDNFTMGAKIREFFYFYEPEMLCTEDPTCEDCKQQGLYARKTFDSMEQLWLALVMRKKYNKVWNNKKEKWEDFLSPC